MIEKQRKQPLKESLQDYLPTSKLGKSKMNNCIGYLERLKSQNH